jgi:hypothetical protein
VGHGLLIHEVSRSHTTTHHSRQDSSGLLSSSQRPLPDNTQAAKMCTIVELFDCWTFLVIYQYAALCKTVNTQYNVLFTLRAVGDYVIRMYIKVSGSQQTVTCSNHVITRDTFPIFGIYTRLCSVVTTQL